MKQEIYAWVAADRTGSTGVMSVMTALGVGPATFQRRKNADMVRDQVQQRADELSVEVKLIRFEEVEEIDSIKPKRGSN